MKREYDIAITLVIMAGVAYFSGPWSWVSLLIYAVISTIFGLMYKESK